MKIESIIKRKNGTTVQFGKSAYHFKPEVPGGPHVAEVADEDHAEKLLTIADGYREASGKTANQTQSPEPAASNGSTVLQGNDGAGQAGGSQEGAPAGSRDDEKAKADAVIVALLGTSIAKIKEAMPDLTADQIATAITFEQVADAPRKSLIDLLTAENLRRATDQSK